MSGTIRSFIAIEIPLPVRRSVVALQRNLGGAGSKVRWTGINNLHITLQFLGDVAVAKLAGIEAALQELALQSAAFEMRLTGVGVFPNARNVRVLWVGANSRTECLNEFAKKVRNRLINFGFSKENRKFHAHLTIGRPRGQLHRAFVESFLATEFDSGTIQVDQFVLMKSELHPTGSIYTPIERFTLNKPR